MIRRGVIGTLAVLLAVGLLVVLPGSGGAQTKTYKIGMSIPVTGADADSSDAMVKGAQMAIDEINQKGGAAGNKLELWVLDSATPAAGQYDPAQAATNYRKYIADGAVVGAIGTMMSGEGKAISPIASEGDMATVSQSATNPDITDPKFKAQYRPKGKPVFFRNVTTDTYQGPNVAVYAKKTLNAKSVYVLDDSGAFGVGVANTFTKKAEELGIKVLGRDRLDPKEADYKTILTKIKGMNPDAIYYGGVQQAAVKLARQLHEIMPKVHKLGSDGIYDLSFPEQAGKDAAEGWVATIAAPDMLNDAKAQEWINKFKSKYKRDPQNYSITSYNGVLVIADAIERVAKAGKPVNKSNVREAIEKTKLNTLQGVIEYDENGDIKNKVVSAYQVKDGKFKYIGVAPEN
jgi:branched-chain amino acid transport system substrate-binding protein